MWSLCGHFDWSIGQVWSHPTNPARQKLKQMHLTYSFENLLCHYDSIMIEEEICTSWNSLTSTENISPYCVSTTQQRINNPIHTINCFINYLGELLFIQQLPQITIGGGVFFVNELRLYGAYHLSFESTKFIKIILAK